MLAFLKLFDPIEWLLIAAITALSVWLGAEYFKVSEARIALSHTQTALAESEKDFAEYKESVAETTRLLQAANDRRALDQLTKVKEAQDAAQVRENALRADADGARKQLDRLRVSLRKALASGRNPVPGAPADAQDQPAATVGQLFLECAAAYADMADKAGQHASDVQTLSDAWPK